MSNIHIGVSNVNQIKAIMKLDNKDLPDKISIKADIIMKFLSIKETSKNGNELSRFIKMLQFFKEKRIRLAMSFPAVARLSTIHSLDKELFIKENIWIADYFQEYLAGNLEILYFLHKKHEEFVSNKVEWDISDIKGDYSLYTFNSKSWDFLLKNGVSGFCIPYEWSKHEMKRFMEHVSHEDSENIECIVYGYIPLMESANCVLKTMGRCKKKNHMSEENFQKDSLFLLDRYKKKFPVIIRCEQCENTIYNSVPLCLYKELDTLEGFHIKNYRFQFTIETMEDVCDILKRRFQMKDYTKGHFAKGIV